MMAHGVNDAWLSLLASPGSILAQRSIGLLMKVLTSAEYGFLGVDIAVEFAHLTGERWYLCRAERENIKWHHIIDLNDWIQIGVEPGLMHGHQGPVGWIASGEHMPLQVAALVFGTPLTYTQMCSLVVHLGGELPKAKGKPSKVVVHKFLISMVVPEDLQAVAHTHVVEGQVVDDFDTGFSELLSELGQDASPIFLAASFISFCAKDAFALGLPLAFPFTFALALAFPLALGFSGSSFTPKAFLIL